MQPSKLYMVHTSLYISAGIQGLQLLLRWCHQDILYSWRLIYISIYQLLLAHGPQVAPSFYETKNNGEVVHTEVPLLATAFYITDYCR
jgi:hypothetical protein